MKHKPTAKEYKDFSVRFKSAMVAAGYDKLTRLEAAERIGFSAGAISYWSNAKRIPRVTLLLNWPDDLGVMQLGL
jgi:hypothetical protein